jgi:anti-sigma factor RsiW
MGAEMADDFTAKLDIYLDGELPADEMKALDIHLRSCLSCATDVLSRVQLKRAMQSAGKRYSPRPEFRLSIQRKIAARSRFSLGRVWLAATAAVAVLFVVGLVTTYVGRQRLERALAFSEVADLHVAALASPNPVDIVSSDHHTVKPWFQGKIPFTFNLPELQNTEFALVGGRVTYLGQAPGAHLIYQVRKHQISVFIFQDHVVSPALRSNSGPLKHVSFNLQSWSEGGLRYVVIGDTSPEDIGKLAELLKAAARS